MITASRVEGLFRQRKIFQLPSYGIMDDKMGIGLKPIKGISKNKI